MSARPSISDSGTAAQPDKRRHPPTQEPRLRGTCKTPYPPAVIAIYVGGRTVPLSGGEMQSGPFAASDPAVIGSLGLKLEQPGVQSAGGEKLLVPAALDDPPLLPDIDAVGVLHRGQPVVDWGISVCRQTSSSRNGLLGATYATAASAPIAAASTAGSAVPGGNAGRRTVKVAPRPTVLSTAIEPPSAEVSRLQMLKPRPAPPSRL